MKGGTIRKRIPILIAVFAFIQAFFAGPAQPKEPPAEPMLRIETGMHTAIIRRIGIDEENRYLVTGSEDKTVRVWELPTGRLIRILRPPIGEGQEGRIYAVALSPDGMTVACGGWTAYDWEQKDSIYLFDRGTGTLVKRIGGMPNAICHLAYSKNGRFLVATLGRNSGIRVFDGRSFDPVFTDIKYENTSYGADFDSKDRIVTASYDGYVRLYRYEGKTFKLVEKKKPKGGSQPHSVRFSPDNTKIAVGFNDSTKVDVLSGIDLSYLYTPDTSKVDNGNLVSVAWSSDGRFLYAGGTYWKDGRPIIKWSDGGTGSARELKAADSTIMDILPLKRGGIAFGAGDPAFGVIDDRGERVFFKGPSIADYRSNTEGFLVSYSGSIVQFGYELWGKSPARFSIPDRLLKLIDASRDRQTPMELKPPLISADGLEIEWDDTLSPKLNKNPLKLEPDERSFSLAIAPDRKTFLLGADWYLRLYDREGKEKWEKPVPLTGAAWAVNISGDGRTAVAALGDGTIRWYRMEDGKELLVLFPHSDKERWIAWTPSGYYDASAGAEELIGWHINRGRDKEADFFPADRLRQQFNRPDVVAKVLETLEIEKALQEADQQRGLQTSMRNPLDILPPTIKILAPPSGTKVSSKELVLLYKATSSTGPIIEIEAKIDGRPAKVRRSEIHSEDATNTRVGEVEIEVPPQNGVVSLIAKNQNGYSEPATFSLKWTGTPDRYKADLYVLAIGVDDPPRVNYAGKDAEDFVNAAILQKGGLYKEVNVQLLTSKKGNAKKDDILDGLDWIRRETTNPDVAMIFLAGHGFNSPEGTYQFFPQDGDLGRYKRTCIDQDEFQKFLKNIGKKVILFLDTCHSGNIMPGVRAEDQQANVDKFANELASAEAGVIVFCSSTGREFSMELESPWKNGVFTGALLEGIEGAADYEKDGNITIAELEAYLSKRVKQLRNGEQKPMTAKPKAVEDYTIFRVMQR